MEELFRQNWLLTDSNGYVGCCHLLTDTISLSSMWSLEFVIATLFILRLRISSCENDGFFLWSAFEIERVAGHVTDWEGRNFPALF